MATEQEKRLIRIWEKRQIIDEKTNTHTKATPTDTVDDIFHSFVPAQDLPNTTEQPLAGNDANPLEGKIG